MPAFAGLSERDHADAGIESDETYMSLQLLNNAVTRGLTVEYIRNADAKIIERSIRIWKKQMLDLIFGS